MTVLYTRNGSYPTGLPEAITLSSGFIRTDPEGFTPEEIADAGYLEAPAQPAYDVEIERLDWDGEVWEVVPLPPPTGDQINAERDRRISAGATFAVPGYGDVPLTGRVRDQTVLLALLVKAQGAKVAGITAPVMVIRDGADANHILTPDQMISLVSSGMNWIEATMQRSWDMKDGVSPFEDGPPLDFTDDAYWP